MTEPTDTPPTTVQANLLAKLAEKRARDAARAAEVPVLPWAGYSVPTLDGEQIYEQNSVDKMIDAAVESITIYEAYLRLIGPNIDPPNKTDSNMCSCPDPAHPDAHKSASYNRDSNLLVCHRDDIGWDVKKLAGMAWGMSTATSDFKPLMHRLALEFRGIDYAHEMEKIKPPAPPLPTQYQIPPLPEAPNNVTQLPPLEARQSEADVLFENEKAREVRRMLVRDDARQEVARIKAAQFSPPVFYTDLVEEFAQPAPAVEWLIEGLHSPGDNTVLTAPRKTGKTTTMMNLVKSLADGVSLFQHHKVTTPAGRIAFFNYEVSQPTFRQTIEEMQISDKSRITHLPLRGVSLDFVDDPAARAWVIQFLITHQITVWIADPLANVLGPGRDENDASHLTKLFSAVDEIKAETGVTDFFLPAHTGKDEEKQDDARGSSRIGDWADQLWILKRDKKTDARTIKAEGRRVSEPTRTLLIDPSDNTLRYGAATSAPGTPPTKEEAKKYDILKELGKRPGTTSRSDLRKMTGNGDISERMIDQLVVEGKIRETRRGSTRLYEFIKVETDMSQYGA